MRMFRHAHFRFSLKSLLGGVILLSVALAAISVWSANSRKQAVAVAKLQSLGATVYYDFHHYYDQGGCLDQLRKPSNWIWARKVLGDDVFSDVYLVNFIEYRDVNSNFGGVTTTFGPVPTPTEVSRNADKYTYLLEALSNLRQLDLEHSEVSDASIPVLEKLHSLEVMMLGDTDITQAGADRLGKSLPNCKIHWSPKERR